MLKKRVAHSKTYLLLIVIILITASSCNSLKNPTPIINGKNYTYEEPNAEKPITGLPRSGHSEFFDLPAKDNANLVVGFYNNLNVQSEQVIILIDTCQDSKTGEFISYENQRLYPVLVESPVKDVEPHHSTEFEINIKNNLLTPGETYICKLKAAKYNEVSKEYESQSFFMNVEK